MRRHDLITLKPGAVVQSVVCCTTNRAVQYVQQWIAEGRAFVSPRQNHRSNTLQLGLAFVDNSIKHRAFVQVRCQDVLRCETPHELTECLGLFSEGEAAVLRRLIKKLKSGGLPLYVFGSVAWEKIAGKPYRTEKSDLDLLCDVATLQDVRYVTDALVAADRELPFRIDGELRFPTDECVNWREVVTALAHHDELDVLVKSEAGVYMSSLDTLLEAAYA